MNTFFYLFVLFSAVTNMLLLIFGAYVISKQERHYRKGIILVFYCDVNKEYGSFKAIKNYIKSINTECQHNTGLFLTENFKTISSFVMFCFKKFLCFNSNPPEIHYFISVFSIQGWNVQGWFYHYQFINSYIVNLFYRSKWNHYVQR